MEGLSNNTNLEIVGRNEEKSFLKLLSFLNFGPQNVHLEKIKEIPKDLGKAMWHF